MKHFVLHVLSCSFLFVLILLALSSAGAQFIQQGPKLVGTGSVGLHIYQGSSVSISADGNTAIVGEYGDNSDAGAVLVYTRSGGVWSQQGNKLVGTGVVGISQQGYSVSLSADGNTAIVGGPADSLNKGAAWVYTRSGGIWTQQGSKLVGTGAVGTVVHQGASVSLSADGNTAIVGGADDSSATGATWVYTRSGGVWSQQGNKLVGTGSSGSFVYQGSSVSISADGNTAIVGGIGTSNPLGAAWVFTRNAGVWSQQGSKLVGTGAVGQSAQGASVSISDDGNTAIVGGYGDNNFVGAAWVYTRSGGTWSQQGSKLVGTGAVGQSEQSSVSISADGNKALVGGSFDNAHAGATWVFTRNAGVWSQQGSKLVGTGAVGSANQGNSVSLSDDGSTAIVGGSGDNSTVGAAWVFLSPYTIMATAGGNGLISPTGSVPVNLGASQRFTFTPASGYHVDSVIIDEVNVPDSMSGYTFVNVMTNHTIRVVFRVNQYTIVAIAGANGIITPTGSTFVDYGTNRQFTFAPASGYYVDSVIVDGVNIPDSLSGYTFINVTTTHTIRVVFRVYPYTIMATAGVNGLITPVGSVPMNLGANQRFTFTPASGYYVDSVIVDGVNVLDSMSGYTFVNVTTNHTIRVVFVHFLPLNLTDGWNMLSVPYLVSDYRKSSIYPTATSRAFTYDGTYQSHDTLHNGSGYWLKFDSTQTLDYNALNAIVRETTNVTIGWNMIGSISKPIATSLITSIPGGVGTSPFIGYFNGYTTADSIIPGRAYWVRVNQSCKLILSSILLSATLNRIQIIPGAEQPPPVPDDHVSSSSKGMPTEFTLSQNYPNPFNPTTVIKYQLPMSAHVELAVYDMLGQVVATLVNNVEEAGYRSVEWNASNIASGMYFYKVVATSIADPDKAFAQVRKMVVMK